ncbi:hypothetical protein [Paenibacillus sp. UMB4589-SE434]|uniref:hypothetical protein n=1 Tax=Paenibacillus sp. UMB4589-SE434 TaxID=3046314 RepID=UPI00255097FB|nr:hypothetical protein [Paenibacillus sp. UMB4589-SE434]MDK8182476.1 hypothetical protein [Paenibacillus sp. UMB4589-SE434]
MKKMIPVVLSLLILLTGCTTHKTIKTEQLTDFKSKILRVHKEINDLKFQMSPTLIEFNYYLNRKPDIGNDKEIFLKTKELALSSEFQNTVIEELYFKNYSKDDRNYPKIKIKFFSTDRDRIEYEYYAFYYGPGFEGERDRPIDRYKTWFFSNFKTNDVQVTP